MKMASASRELKCLESAAKAVRNAKALVVTCGAGMGCDSGLPDFRGKDGFWRAYPPLKDLGITLPDMSNPKWFDTDPEFAWGFFGHRYHLYENAVPHRGFEILKRWGEKMESGYFVFTSNVDGHFQKAGYHEDKIIECHGSIHFMQCIDTNKCGSIWPVPKGSIKPVSVETLRMDPPLPMGPPETNEFPARPNILMFGDWGWVNTRERQQMRNYAKFKAEVADKPIVVVEIGAGTAVPTVRYESEEWVDSRFNHKDSVLIRINPGEPEVPDAEKNIGLPMKGLAALEEIDGLLKAM